MNVKEVLKIIAYGQPRAFNNTNLLVDIAKTTDSVVVCATSGQAQELNTANNIKTACIDSLSKSLLEKKTALYDNYALSVIASAALVEIERLESEVRKHEENLFKISKIASKK